MSLTGIELQKMVKGFLIRSQGVSRAKLAAEANISVSSLEQVIQKAHLPRPAHTYALLKAMGYDADKFFPDAFPKDAA
jgi:transcriptional regulator with XRE-family HTH domain